MKRIIVYCLFVALASGIVGCGKKAAVGQDASGAGDAPARGDSVAQVVESDVDVDTLLHRTMEKMMTLSTERDTAVLFDEVRKALRFEQAFLKCFELKHGESSLSAAEKADSMVNESYRVFDKLEEGFTIDMVEYANRRYFLMKYKELLCYRGLVDKEERLSGVMKRAITEEALAWSRFIGAYIDIVLSGIQLEYFGGGSMVAIESPYSVLGMQECRYESLLAIGSASAVGRISKKEDNREERFLSTVKSGIAKLADPSIVECIDEDRRSEYLNVYRHIEKDMLPRLTPYMRAWAEKRRALLKAITGKDDPQVQNGDEHKILKRLESMIDFCEEG